MSLLDVSGLDIWLQTIDGNRLHIVRDVALTADANRRIGLVGESGCGKSTIAKAVLGLLPFSATVSGSIRFDGVELLVEDGKPLDAVRGNGISMVTQSAMNALNPVQRVGRQIVEGMPAHVREDAGARRKRLAELLDAVGLQQDCVSQFPHQLSGGMRQRVCIAIALATEPRLLIADEPTTALDTLVQAQIMETLDALCDEFELGVILVSHDLSLVTSFCDRIAVMYGGRIVEDGPTGNILADRAHPYTRMLFEAVPTLSTQKSDIHSVAGRPPTLDYLDTHCPFLDRCDSAIAACGTSVPARRRLSNGSTVSCHIAGDRN